MPPQTENPPFDEAWQAQVMALAVALQEQGFCSAAEWSERLGAEIVAAQQRGDPDDGSTYYQHVLATVEGLVRDKDLLSADALLARRADWEAAYRRTPHGQPVVLSAHDAPEDG